MTPSTDPTNFDESDDAQSQQSELTDKTSTSLSGDKTAKEEEKPASTVKSYSAIMATPVVEYVLPSHFSLRTDPN